MIIIYAQSIVLTVVNATSSPKALQLGSGNATANQISQETDVKSL